MPEPAPPPSIGYYLGALSEMGAKVERNQVLDEIAEAGAKLFDTLMDAAIDGLGLQKQPPRARLDFYLSKTPEEWAEQQIKDPEWYEQDYADFERLVARARDEDWDGIEEPV